MEETNCGIYQIRNLVNDKVYNGQTNNLTDRENKWSQQLKNKEGRYNQHLERSYHKYGPDNFTFNILIENLLPEQLDEYEIAMIKFTKSHDPDFGYNKTEGGEGGSPNEETREKQSKSATGRKRTIESRKKQSESITGEGHFTKKMTSEELEEHGKKISVAKKGIKHPTIRGSKNPSAKLTEQDVFEIKSYLLVFGHLKDFASKIARVYDVKPVTIRRIKRNERWTHVKVPGWD